MVVSNVTSGQLFVSNTKIYQGTSNTNTTFTAMVDRYTQSSGQLRIFDYKGSLNTTQPLISDDGLVTANVVSISYYGDGQAKATAGFENGLIRLPGLYINTDGHVSSDKRMQDGDKYHNFSYVINTKKDYQSFKTVLNEVVHPIGTKTFIVHNDEYNESMPVSMNDWQYIQYDLPYTFNVSVNSNNAISTNLTANVSNTINVGDVLLFKSVSKSLAGNVSLTDGSNTIIGISTNFINDIQDGDTIELSSGNTEVVISVEDDNTLITQNTINITSSGVLINLLFTDTKTVTYSNANTVLLDSNFITNSEYVVTSIQKVK